MLPQYDFYTLASNHSAWSQVQFGNDAKRGPIGPLTHLQKEVVEAIEAEHDPASTLEDRLYEYSDCLLLILDASRRSGFTPKALIEYASKKLALNKQRIWGEPTAEGALFHKKGEE